MNLKLREEGLQIEAVLCMGNSIYAVALGVATTLIFYIFSKEGVNLFNNFFKEDLFIKIPSLILVPILALYYIFDWHDFNLATYFDKKIGVSQMYQWIICVLLISFLAICAFNKSLILEAFFSSIYFLQVLKKRDSLFELGGTETINEAFLKGQNKLKYNSLKFIIRFLGYLILFILTFLFVFWLLKIFLSSVPWITTINNNFFPIILLFLAWIILLTWGLNLWLKFFRSKHCIEIQYKKEIVRMNT